MISIKNPKDIEQLTKAGSILASILDELVSFIKPGIRTIDLDIIAEKRIHHAGCRSAFKGYKNEPSDPPYPTTLCTSVNDEVVHAPSSERILKSGDIVGIDIGLAYPQGEREYFVDMAKTIPVGEISPEAKKLLSVAQEALRLAMLEVKPGGYVSDIGAAIQLFVEHHGFSVVRQLVGHGVGYRLHEEPRVPNYREIHDPKIRLEQGMVLAIEPMINAGGYQVKTLSDGWTVATADGSLSAHFEHTIVVTKSGSEIVTR